MMDVSGVSIVDALSHDNLTDILVRLDAVSVLRCRAVCKSWRRITTDRSFLTAHAAGRPREMIVKTEHGFARSAVPLSPTPTEEVVDGDGPRRRYLFDPCQPAAEGNRCPEFELYASLDGLLVLKHRRRGRYVICNPATRQWRGASLLPWKLLRSDDPAAPPAVPRLRCDVACGFYFHASSGEYRLLFHCVRRVGSMEVWDHGYVVLSFGGALPRRLAQAPPLKELHPSYELPVSYRGSLHWLSGHPQGSSTGKMLAFDTASETFRLMARPPVVPELTAAWSLLEQDGELSVAAIHRATPTLDVWALQDYAAEKWALRHRLTVQPPPWSLGNWGDAHFCVILGNAACGTGRGTIVIGFVHAGAAIVYSLKDNKVLREIKLEGDVSFRIFSESVVPHAFFDAPPCTEMVPLSFSVPLLKREGQHLGGRRKKAAGSW